MSDVPKIVHDRLRAAVPREAHPDADMLTAFAEQALSGGEREMVVRHLAHCGDCREVIALSIPPLEAVPPAEGARDEVSARATLNARSRSWFAWPTLRWAGLAAGVVAVASVLILQPGKQPERTAPAALLQDENKVRATDVVAERVTPVVNELSHSTAERPVKPGSALVLEKRTARRDAPEPRREQTRIASASVPPANDKREGSVETKQSFAFSATTAASTGGNYSVEKVPAAPTASAKTAITASDALNGSSQEVVVVNGAAVEVQPSPAEGKLMARNAEPLPINKAKPAAKEEGDLKSQVEGGETQAQSAPAYLGSNSTLALQKQRSKQSKDRNIAAQWSLAQGRLQRSVDAGGTWQIALQLEHPLLSFGARGGDVWAGGQSGTLFHSADSGTTWAMVQPSTNAGALAADIVAIEIRGPADVVLSTSNNESWSSTDGGKTWEKK